MNIIKISGGVCAADGFTASGVHCGIRKNKSKLDLALIYSEARCSAASVYTKNKVVGAPIIVTKQNLSDGYAHAIICNSGNANTCNADGVDKAVSTCKEIATALKINDSDVIVASTGVIGQPLDVNAIISGIPSLVDGLSTNGDNAAEAILTTDLVKKEIAVEFMLSGRKCKLGGIAKGSGMIHPNMATMLCFITTDACISPEMLQKVLTDVVNDSFNMVSVDGDTSTNDMVSVLANSAAKNPCIESENDDYNIFHQALLKVCTHLCRMVAGDGEGATKLLECNVTGAPTKQVARLVSKSVITSSLFKAAMFGEDANWGRILCAIGYTDAEFNIENVDVELRSERGAVNVCKNGSGIDFSEEKASDVLSSDEIRIEISLGNGDGAATAWGCDLSYDYVKINGDYRS